MFGMGEEKKGKTPEFSFDMENDLKDPASLRKMQEYVASKVQGIKQALRQGENKEMFDKTQCVLDGYLSLQKVINRINRK